jgi:hypothetical protein
LAGFRRLNPENVPKVLLWAIQGIDLQPPRGI